MDPNWHGPELQHDFELSGIGDFSRVCSVNVVRFVLTLRFLVDLRVDFVFMRIRVVGRDFICVTAASTNPWL